jgi:hypothetical protein
LEHQIILTFLITPDQQHPSANNGMREGEALDEQKWDEGEKGLA